MHSARREVVFYALVQKALDQSSGHLSIYSHSKRILTKRAN